MGVRFECPAGHKLHVKAHLAGQRGICPECGVRFIVPTFSGGRVDEASGSGSFTPTPGGLDLPDSSFDFDEESVLDLPELPSAPRNGKAQLAPTVALTPAAALRLKRRKANQRLTVILAFLALVLLVVLVVVMTRPKGDAAPAEETPIAAPADAGGAASSPAE